ncbi:MAG: GAK system ATP-grasp enzyme [Desulfovibrionaceae bacterium]
MRIGVIGTKGVWSTEKLVDAFAEKTGHRLLVEMDKVRLELPSGACWFGDANLAELDGLVVKKIGSSYSPDLLDRLEILRFLNHQGVKCFSKPKSLMRLLDRMSCTITLQAHDIPMPPTTVTASVDEAMIALEAYGEAVFKPLYSTKARGMFVQQFGPDAREHIEDYHSEHRTIYLQKTIDMGDMDLAIAFMGGDYLTTYARAKQDKNQWNTTTAAGGKYVSFDPPQEIIDLAQKAQSLFDLEFAVVDTALTEDGPRIFEVSTFGGFKGIQEARGIDASKLYVDHIIKRMKQ